MPSDWRHVVPKATTGDIVASTLAEWDYVRSSRNAPIHRSREQAIRLPAHFTAFAEFLGPAWKVNGAPTTADVFDIQATLEWIPYAKFIHLQSFGSNVRGESIHLIDAFIYRHPTFGTLNCLGLSKWGSVYQGEVTTLDDGTLQVGLLGYTGNQTTSHVLQLRPGGDGAVSITTVKTE